MNKYGIVAVKAAKNLAKFGGDPVKEWEKQANLMFGRGTSMAKKACPKSTFLSLCEFDIVEGVQSGEYTRSVINKRHAYDAVIHLLETKDNHISPSELWKIIASGKTHNSQMDVVCALYKNDLFKIK